MQTVAFKTVVQPFNFSPAVSSKLPIPRESRMTDLVLNELLLLHSITQSTPIQNVKFAIHHNYLYRLMAASAIMVSCSWITCGPFSLLNMCTEYQCSSK